MLNLGAKMEETEDFLDSCDVCDDQVMASTLLPYIPEDKDVSMLWLCPACYAKEMEEK